MVAHWLLTALPLIIASPILAVLLSMDQGTWLRTMLALLVGTPALAALATIGAAVTVSLKRGGLLAPVLILPLSIPVLIFGVAMIGAPEGSSAALLFLSALERALRAQGYPVPPGTGTAAAGDALSTFR